MEGAHGKVYSTLGYFRKRVYRTNVGTGVGGLSVLSCQDCVWNGNQGSWVGKIPHQALSPASTTQDSQESRRLFPTESPLHCFSPSLSYAQNSAKDSSNSGRYLRKEVGHTKVGK